MSLATGRINGARVAPDTRAALVAALASVEGIAADSLAPDQATAGSAWPRWVQTTFRGALCELALHEYDVFVVLPADYAAHTVDNGDRLRDAVAPALLALQGVVIDYAEPVQVTFSDSQAMPGIRFRVRFT